MFSSIISRLSDVLHRKDNQTKLHEFVNSNRGTIFHEEGLDLMEVVDFLESINWRVIKVDWRKARYGYIPLAFSTGVNPSLISIQFDIYLKLTLKLQRNIFSMQTNVYDYC